MNTKKMYKKISKSFDFADQTIICFKKYIVPSKDEHKEKSIGISTYLLLLFQY